VVANAGTPFDEWFVDREDFRLSLEYVKVSIMSRWDDGPIRAVEGTPAFAK